jgi:hypothetical protein
VSRAGRVKIVRKYPLFFCPTLSWMLPYPCLPFFALPCTPPTHPFPHTPTRTRTHPHAYAHRPTPVTVAHSRPGQYTHMHMRTRGSSLCCTRCPTCVTKTFYTHPCSSHEFSSCTVVRPYDILNNFTTRYRVTPQCIRLTHTYVLGLCHVRVVTQPEQV